MLSEAANKLKNDLPVKSIIAAIALISIQFFFDIFGNIASMLGYFGVNWEVTKIFIKENTKIILVLFTLSLVATSISLFILNYKYKILKMNQKDIQDTAAEEIKKMAKELTANKRMVPEVKHIAKKFADEDKMNIGKFISTYYLNWLKIRDKIDSINLETTIVECQKDQRKIFKEIASLLEDINRIVSVATGLDTSCNIKVWHQKNYLITKWRTPSDEENEKRDSNSIEPRKREEYFYIYPKDNVSKIKNKSKKMFTQEQRNLKYGKKFKKIRYNSAYNAIYDSEEPYWFGNDLPKLVDNNRYFSSSDDYELYYTSLAIFKIEDAIIEQEIHSSSGLLIFDLNGYEFNQELLKPYGVFIARSLHLLLTELDSVNKEIIALKG